MNPSRAPGLLLLPLALVLTACQSVPYTGRSHLLMVSASEEHRMGEEAYRDLLKKARVSTDTEKLSLLRGVGKRIAAAADKPDFQWEFTLIEDDKQVNAFCLPGGKVAFYTGILPVTAGEDGIAVVMGHEVAHALARHGAERMSQGMLADFGGKALSVLLADQPAGTRDLYAQAYGLGVGLGVLLPYSRAHESEADRIGLILMAKAGYDPAHALSFWKRMAAAAGGAGASSPLAGFMRTHPTDEKRQTQISAWLPEVKEKYYRPAPAVR